MTTRLNVGIGNSRICALALIAALCFLLLCTACCRTKAFADGVLPANGTTVTFPASYGVVYGDTWDIFYNGSSSPSFTSVTGHTGSWTVSYTSSPTPTITVSAPTGTSVGNYIVDYTTNPDGDDSHGYIVGFAVPATRPTARPGSAFSFEQSVGGVNLCNGNKLTTIPIVAWTAKGGLPVSLSLNHSSQSSRDLELGEKWIMSYDSYLTVDGSSNVTVNWGDETNYTFILKPGGFSDPPGVFDQLTVNYGSPNTYDLVTPNQVKYHFAQVSGLTTPYGSGQSGWYFLSSITDKNGNAITISRDSNERIQYITDPTSRKITLAYDASGRISTISDPLSRTWTLSYNTSNELSSILLPPVVSGGTATLSNYFTYDTSYRIYSFTDPATSSTSGKTTGPFTYNSDSSLATGKDAVGNQTTFTYNTSSTVVTDPNGNANTYNIAWSRVNSVKDPLSLTESYTYDYADNVVADLDKNSGNWQSTYSTTGAGASVETDPKSDVFTTNYTTDNEVYQSIINPGGTNLTTTYAYDSNDNLTSVVDAMPSPGPYTTTFTPYPTSDTARHGLLETATDPLSHSTNYDYDSNGYCKSVEDANSHASTATYNALGWISNSTDPLAHETQFFYDNWGRTVAVEAPDNTISRTAYDNDSNVAWAADADSMTGPLGSGDSLVASQTGFGNAISFTGASSDDIDTGAHSQPVVDTSNSFSVAAWVKIATTQENRICSQSGVNTDGFRFLVNNGNSLFFGFYASDSSSATAQNVWSGTLTNSTWYHAVGVFDAKALTITLYINGSQVSTETLPGGWVPWKATGHFLVGSGYGNAYPMKGNLDELRLYDRALTSSEVSSLYGFNPGTSSATAQVSNGLSHYFAFDNSWYDYVDSTPTSPVYDIVDYGHMTRNVYDADNRLTQTVNGRGDAVSYAYDGSDPRTGNSQTQKGLLSSKTDGNGHVTYYAYSIRNESTYTKYPNGSTESCTYDNVGNKKTHTDQNGTVITYAYDAANRMTGVSYAVASGVASTSSLTLGYDNADRQTSMLDGTGTTYWGYDNDSRVSTVTTPQMGSYPTYNGLTYAYDGAGRETQKTLYNVGNWYYTYYPGNELETVKSPNDGSSVTTLAYNADDTLYTRTATNGAVTTYGYDIAAQLTGISTANSSATVLQSSSFAHDDAGYVQSRTIWGGGSVYPVDSYQYDGAGELTYETQNVASAVYPDTYSYRYLYDHNGNRASKDWGTGTVDSYAYNASTDELASAGSYGFTYDASGNTKTVTQSGSTLWTYGYDGEDRLVTASKTGVSDSFVYNGLGNRVNVHDSTQNANQLTDGTDPTSPLLENGISLFNPGLSEKRGTTVDWYAPDQLGTTMGVLDSSQVEQTKSEYDAFGNLLSMSGTVPGGSPNWVVPGYAGYQGDPDTGLIRAGNRYYNPYFGRWITQDPIGDGDNWYAYCGNEPIDQDDPSGFDPTKPYGVPDWAKWDPESQTWTGMDPYNGTTYSWNPKGVPLGAAAKVTWIIPNAFSTWEAPILDSENWYMGGMGGWSADIDDTFMHGSWDRWGTTMGDSKASQRDRFKAGAVAVGWTVGYGVALAVSGRFVFAIGECVLARAGLLGATQVTQWGGMGFASGSWVMTGGKSAYNWIMSGVFTKYDFVDEQIDSPQSQVMDNSELAIPNWWQGMTGQRIIK